MDEPDEVLPERFVIFLVVLSQKCGEYTGQNKMLQIYEILIGNSWILMK